MRGTRLVTHGLALVLVLPAATHAGGGVAAPPRAFAPPPEAARLHAEQYGRVQPSVRFWIGIEARKLAQAAPAAVSEAGVVGTVRARFAGQPMAAGDAETLAALVLMEAAKQAERDLKAIAEKQRAALEAKKKLRELQDKLDEQVAAAAGQLDSRRCVAPRCGGLGLAAVTNAVRQASSTSRVALPTREPETVGELRATRDQLENRLDSLSELGETESLRLQMAMDRLSRMMSALSNILKKASDTAQSITENLK
jgi:uncharacterized membrane protein